MLAKNSVAKKLKLDYSKLNVTDIREFTVYWIPWGELPPYSVTWHYLLNTMREIVDFLCHVTFSTEYHVVNCRRFMSQDNFTEYYVVNCRHFLSCNTFYWIPRGKLPPIYVTWQFYRIFCGKLPPFFIMWHFLLQTMW